MLTRTDILTPRPRRTKPVPTPEWREGSSVNVKLMSTTEFLAMSEMEKKHPKKGAAMWIIHTVVDDDGMPVFTEADVDAFGELEISAVNRIVSEAQALNIRSTADLAKNSEATQSGV